MAAVVVVPMRWVISAVADPRLPLAVDSGTRSWGARSRSSIAPPITTRLVPLVLRLRRRLCLQRDRALLVNGAGKISGTVHSDRARELIAAVDQLRKEGVYNWVHSKAVPHRPTSRGCIEREIGVVLDATRCSLEQSGFPLSWWPKAVRYQCFALNVSDDSWSRARGSAGDNYRFHPAEFGDALSMRGKLTAYERRHGEAYTGLDLPLGCRVRYRQPEPALKSKH